MVTPISEWEPQAEEVTLPSGKVVKLKRPDLVSMISGEGDVPDVLSNMILSMVNGSGGSKEIDINPETLPQIMSSLNVIAKACFVEPLLWDNPQRDETHIPVSWVTFGDKGFVMAWALGGQYEPVKTFPPAANGNMATVPTSNKLSRKAKHNFRNTG